MSKAKKKSSQSIQSVMLKNSMSLKYLTPNAKNFFYAYLRLDHLVITLPCLVFLSYIATKPFQQFDFLLVWRTDTKIWI